MKPDLAGLADTVDKKPSNLIQYARMRHISRLLLLCAGGSLLLLTGCQTGQVASGGPYHVTAYQAARPVQGARDSFALERKHLCDGRRPLSHGGGVFCRDAGQTDAERQFQDLLQAGAQTFGIVRV